MEQAADARLRGKPVAVGGERRGIIASASYEARKMGIYTPMPTARARQLCPRLIILPGNYDRYELFSRWMFAYAFDFTPEVEMTGIDEGYFDLSGARKPAGEIAAIIQKAIRQKLKISVSEGLGTSKLISQIASKCRKPSALVQVPPGEELKFLHPLPNKWLPGIGPRTAIRLDAAGLRQIRHIAATPAEQLELLLGSQAASVRDFARGIDDRPLIVSRAAPKSFGSQETFSADITDEDYLEAVLRRMADKLMAKVREEGKAIRTLTVKVRYNDMAEDQRSDSLAEPTDLETDLYSRLRPLLRLAWKRRVSLRLVSLKLSQVYDSLRQGELPLDDRPDLNPARRALARTVDTLRRTHGDGVLLRAHDLRLRQGPRDDTEKNLPALFPAPREPRSTAPVRPAPASPDTSPPEAPPPIFSGHIPRPAASPSLEKNRGTAAAARTTAPAVATSSAAVLLNVRSWYSFLDSTLSPPAIVELALEHGMNAIAITDAGNLHGAPEFARAIGAANLLLPEDRQIKPLYGAEIRTGGSSLLCYVSNAQGYRNLCRLLSDPVTFGSPAAAATGTPAGAGAGADGFPLSRTKKSPAAARFAPAKKSFPGAASGTFPQALPVHFPEPHPDSGAGTDLQAESTAARQRRPLSPERLQGLTGGLIAVSDNPALAELFPGRFYLAVPSARAAAKAPRGLPALLAPRIHYARPEDRLKWDIMQSIRTRTLLRQPHPDKKLRGHFHFRSPAELLRLAGSARFLLDHSRELADRCDFSFPAGLPQFPAWPSPDGRSSRVWLRELVMKGLHLRYQEKAPLRIAQAEEELGIIAEVGYEDYFLLIWDLLKDCRDAGISWITRGSAADSLVCYCLGISNVCPIHFGLYFKRFLNKDRMAVRKLPDIDIDFPHDRKDEVVEMLFRKHGPDHCAIVGGFSTYRARGAVGDVAKVLGLSEHQTRRLTERLPWSFTGTEGHSWNGIRRTDPRPSVPAGPTPSPAAAPSGPGKPPPAPPAAGHSPENPDDAPAASDSSHAAPEEPLPVPPDKGQLLLARLRERPESVDLPLDEEPFRTALLTAGFLDGAPRGPKMHPCGIILSRDPMPALTPVFSSHGRGWPVSHYDMDAVETMGLIKMDILAQGGLSAIRDTRAALAARGITPDETIIRSWQDDRVWKMIASGGARAVHHIESPAMTSLCGMVNVSEIHGLIAIVSVIRPGAANENKKLSFIRAYQNPELATYPHPCLEPCLKDTFGLIVYEEHILQICDVFAGMTPGQSDALRKALTKQDRTAIERIEKEFRTLARRHPNGCTEQDISRVWSLLASFQGYAFNKAHSTAYGVEAWEAAVLKYYHPAEFMAAVLTNGKGFYPRLVYVLECHRLGLRLLPPCLNDPGPGFMVRDGAIRVPVAAIKGLTRRTLAGLEQQHRAGRRFSSLTDFHNAVSPSAEELEALIRAGACGSFCASRTRLFWEAQTCRRRQQEHRTGLPGTSWLLPPVAPPAPLPAAAPASPALPPPDPASPPVLTEPPLHERLEAEMELFGYTVSAHPLELHHRIDWDTYCPVAKLREFRGRTVVLCGLIVVSRVHHQVTGEAMKFLTLADRTGMVESELFGGIYRRFGPATVRYPVLEVTATVVPFENGNGHTLRIHHAGKPRLRPSPGRPAASGGAAMPAGSASIPAPETNQHS